MRKKLKIIVKKTKTNLNCCYFLLKGQFLFKFKLVKNVNLNQNVYIIFLYAVHFIPDNWQTDIFDVWCFQLGHRPPLSSSRVLLNNVRKHTRVWVRRDPTGKTEGKASNPKTAGGGGTAKFFYSLNVSPPKWTQILRYGFNTPSREIRLKSVHRIYGWRALNTIGLNSHANHKVLSLETKRLQSETFPKESCRSLWGLLVNLLSLCCRLCNIRLRLGNGANVTV